MYTVLLFLLAILQWIVLIVVLGAFGLLVVAGLYFVSSDFRQNPDTGKPSMQVHGLPKRYASLFEEVAEEYWMDPKYTIADAKAQDAADADIVDKSTEFRKDFE